jgi:hypothetical protein
MFIFLLWLDKSVTFIKAGYFKPLLDPGGGFASETAAHGGFRSATAVTNL